MAAMSGRPSSVRSGSSKLLLLPVDPPALSLAQDEPERDDPSEPKIVLPTAPRGSRPSVMRPMPTQDAAATPDVAPAPALLKVDPDSPAAPGELHFGLLLRRARESRGLSLNEVAEKTRISPRWIQALEDAQLDILPAPVFVSGYLRSYARLVGLDGALLLSRYQELARKRAQALAPVERGFTVRRHGQPIQVPTWAIAMLLSVVTALVLAALWLTNTLWRR